MKNNIISDSIRYVGADDKTIDLFEGQYVVPNGISYNSYIIMDEQIAVMDTVDSRACDRWLDNISRVLQEKTPDYLVISHVEPDHSGSIKRFIEKYPDTKLVGNAKTFPMLNNFFDGLNNIEKVIVKEGDQLQLGLHKLQFIMAPMVHWPEVMMSYEQTEKVLFSADAFGKFGALDTDEDWDCEARRYYFNIVGKYGIPVQTVLKKASALDIGTICPLHGPILNDDLEHYIGKYMTWSSYQPEDKGIFIAYSSIHGNTAKAAQKLSEILKDKGAGKVVLTDLSRCDMAEAVEDAFRYDRLVAAAPSYDGGVFPIMEDFLLHLKAKAYQNRTVAIIENGSWAPSAAKKMQEYFSAMKNITIMDQVITIRSSMKETDIISLEKLAESLID